MENENPLQENMTTKGASLDEYLPITDKAHKISEGLRIIARVNAEYKRRNTTSSAGDDAVLCGKIESSDDVSKTDSDDTGAESGHFHETDTLQDESGNVSKECVENATAVGASPTDQSTGTVTHAIEPPQSGHMPYVKTLKRKHQSDELSVEPMAGSAPKRIMTNTSTLTEPPQMVSKSTQTKITASYFEQRRAQQPSMPSESTSKEATSKIGSISHPAEIKRKRVAFLPEQILPTSSSLTAQPQERSVQRPHDISCEKSVS